MRNLSLKYRYLKSESHSLVVVLVIILLLSYLANNLLPYSVPKYTNSRFMWVPELTMAEDQKAKARLFLPSSLSFLTALTRLQQHSIFLATSRFLVTSKNIPYEFP